jgi:cytochrome c oxidase subunit 2
MIDSKLVLWGQTVGYTAYVLAVMAGMSWFVYKLTREGSSKQIPNAAFYTVVAFLVAVGVSLHIVTHETIPWKKMDLNRANIVADKTFDIRVADHKFILPAEKMTITVGEKALFKVTSDDLTYGFGLFREDNSMLFQMQVLPGHMNDILWHFESPGLYTIRSTEYSGPKGIQMIEKNVVEVVANPNEVLP